MWLKRDYIHLIAPVLYDSIYLKQFVAVLSFVVELDRAIYDVLMLDSVSSLEWFMSNQFRTFRVRFHYGHLDVFYRIFHNTLGEIHLSEDIFAGYVSISRRGNVTKHECIQVGKGRDVGGVMFMEQYLGAFRQFLEKWLSNQAGLISAHNFDLFSTWKLDMIQSLLTASFL
ncbi:hypothetical protein MKW98_021304, partial [Papaver atlanticum]